MASRLTAAGLVAIAIVTAFTVSVPATAQTHAQTHARVA